MKGWVFIFIIFITLTMSNQSGYSQEYNNMVPNPSFENYNECPDSICGINKVEDWFSVCGSCIESFNECSLNATVSVPQNGWGNQMAFTGQGYSQFGTTVTIVTHREYLGCKLISKLNPNILYCFEMHISLAEWSSVACDQIAVLLTDSAITCPIENLGNISWYSPQITTPVYQIYQDTLSWVKITGTFIAEGNEQYLTIGFFKENDSINWIYRHDYWAHWAEYYLDDVYLYEADKPPLPANAGDDRLICRGDSVQLGSTGYLDYTYQWSTAEKVVDTSGSIWVRPEMTTTYYLKQTDFRSVTSYDTVLVVVKNCDTAADSELVIPNVFTPNGDGKNDYFEILNPGHLHYRIMIFNRWGEKINENDGSQPWDGNHKQKPLPAGVYFYTLTCRNKSGTESTGSGVIHLVR